MDTYDFFLLVEKHLILSLCRYPEETNDCCMYLTAANADRLIKYSIQTKERTSVFKQVEVGRLEKSGSGGGGDGAHALKFKDDLDPILSNVETSVWAVEVCFGFFFFLNFDLHKYTRGANLFESRFFEKILLANFSD